MPDRKSNKKHAKQKPADEDENVIARRIVDEATDNDGGGREPMETTDTADEREDPAATDEPTNEQKREAARILGRLGGLKGGPARAEKLSQKRRRQIAKKAAQARWGQKRKDTES